MSRKSLQILPESQSVEWKQSLGEWEEIVETCAAFATSKGGTIYVGISPKGEGVGVQLGQGTLEDLANKIKVNTDPPQFPTIEVGGTEKAAIIQIHVEHHPVKPVWAFGRPMKRVGRTNQLLRRDEAQRLLEATIGRTWDAYACEGFLARDISKAAVKDFLGRAEMKKSTPLGDVVRNLRLGGDTHFCNAAVLLFGKFPQRFFVEAKLKCARFKGVDSVHFLDERTIEGTIFHQLDEAMAFVARNTRRALLITGKPAHEVIPEYPEQAVREAIINALCHRNYAEVGTTQVRIFDDRLEVWNPGTLPRDLLVTHLYRQHASRPRNPLLANVLFRARLIEQWGTGTLRIIEACASCHIKVEFETDMGTFIVRLRQQPQDLPSTEAELDVATQSPTQSGDPVSRLLSALQTRAMSSSELRMALGVKHRPTFRQNYLHPALASGLIAYTIPDKPNSRLQKYRLTEKGRSMLRQETG